MGGDDELFRHVGLEYLGTDDTLTFEDVLVCPFHIFPVFGQTVVLPHATGCALFGVPVLRTAIDTRGDYRTFTVYGDTAHDGGRAVSLYLVPVDVEQYPECTAHGCMSFMGL